LIVLLFGPPGSGKGTQAAFIAKRFNIPAISTGEILRGEVKAQTPLGLAAQTIMQSGGLVGDDIMNPMVANRLAQPDCTNGFLLDGYPRTLPQALYLDQLFAARKLQDPTAVYLDVPSEALVARITARRQCPVCKTIYNLLFKPPKVEGKCDLEGATLVQRADDTEAVIRERLKAYEAQTGPVIEHYMKRGGERIDGALSVEAIWQRIEALLSTKPHGGTGANRAKA